MQENDIPLLDCPVDYILGEASGKLLNEYGRFPCKIKCGTYAFMAEGWARATINITECEFKKDDVVYIEPGSFLLIRECSEDAKACYIIFSSLFLEKNMYGTRRPFSPIHGRAPIIHLTEEQSGIVRNFSMLMADALNCTPPMLTAERMVDIYNLIQHTYIDYFLAENGATGRSADRKTEIYHEYSDMVMRHYHEWHHVSEYAEAMHVTMPHLCSTIKSVSNRTAGDLIIETILTDAKAQLKITTQPIKEIALNLGFDNVGLFNRFFKVHTGVTPKVYRQS